MAATKAISKKTSDAKAEAATPGERILEVAAGFRLSFSGLSQTKSVSDTVQKEIADDYDADTAALRTIKKLIPSDHPAVKALNGAKGKITTYFNGITIPFPEQGVRLYPARGENEEVRSQALEKFIDSVDALIADYYAAAKRLDEQWQSVLKQAQKEQGKLFNAEDYPTSVLDRLQCKLLPYNVDIPRYYERMSPRHYQEAKALLQARFEEAARLQEQYVAKLMSDAVDQMSNSISGFHEGKQKAFKNSVVDNVLEAMQEFNDKTRPYGIGGDAMAKAFDKLYKAMTTDASGQKMRPQDIADELRKNKELAAQVTKQIAEMGEKIASLAEVVPRRVLARR